MSIVFIILIFCLEYRVQGMKRPPDMPTAKYILAITGICFLVCLTMIPICWLIYVDMPTGYTDSAALFSGFLSALPFPIAYILSKIYIKGYKNTSPYFKKYTNEEREKKEAYIKEYNRRRKEESSTDTKSTTSCNLMTAETKIIENPPTLPDGVSLGKDNLPYIINREYGYGKKFNAFVTKSGRFYHRSKCPSIRFQRKILIHRYTAIRRNYKPCTRCKPLNYIDGWYNTYLDYKNQEFENK